MANNYDQLPRVEFEVNLADFKRLERIARTLEAAGLQGAYAEFQREYANALRVSKQFIRNAGADEVDAAQKIESQQVGHSKSGYIPTGTLQGSITPQFSRGGLKVSVVPLATSVDADKARQKAKGGKAKHFKPGKGPELHYYGVDVEFGNSKMAAEPFMKPSGEKVATKLDGEFEQAMRRALR